MPFNPRLWQAERERMRQAPYHLDDRRRRIVLAAFQEASEFRGWVLLAAHVRETHVHLVIHGLEPPEKVMVDLKRYASRKLNEARVDSLDRKRWARHGSTRYLWKPDAVEAPIHYVIHEQGEPMAIFENPDRSLTESGMDATKPARPSRGPDDSDPSRERK
jgi:REP element-mobilizing transposase RayT